MTALHSFIPLYFGEEDQDIWAALCQIEPEQRPAVIKGMLRQTLLGDKDETPTADLPGTVPAEGEHGAERTADPAFRTDSPGFVDQDERSLGPDFDLNDLFIPQPDRTADGSCQSEFDRSNTDTAEAIDSECILDDLPGPGHRPYPAVQNLLINIIGQEDDEEIIRLFAAQKLSHHPR